MAHSHHTHSTPSTEAERLAAALNGHRAGRSWQAHCPAHDDRHPSLQITEKEENPSGAGRVVLREQVLDALKQRSLWGKSLTRGRHC